VPFDLGSMTANFPITAAPQGQGPTTITATLGGVSQAVTLTVAPRPITLVALQLSSTIISQGQQANGTVTLSGPAPAGATIALSSSAPAVANVPPSVPAAPGASTSQTFPITTSSIGSAVITATFGNSITATVTVVKTKEKEKEKEKLEKPENEKFAIDKAITIDKVREIHFAPLLPMPTLIAAGNGVAGGQAAIGRAFIRADERPPIPPPG
jgi:hypothetical protein